MKRPPPRRDLPLWHPLGAGVVVEEDRQGRFITLVDGRTDDIVRLPLTEDQQRKLAAYLSHRFPPQPPPESYQ